MVTTRADIGILVAQTGQLAHHFQCINLRSTLATIRVTFG